MTYYFFKRGILLSALNRHGFFRGCQFITSIYNTMRGQMLLSPFQRPNLHSVRLALYTSVWYSKWKRLSSLFKIQNSEFGIQNSEFRIRNSEFRIVNCHWNEKVSHLGHRRIHRFLIDLGLLCNCPVCCGHLVKILITLEHFAHLLIWILSSHPGMQNGGEGLPSIVLADHVFFKWIRL